MLAARTTMQAQARAPLSIRIPDGAAVGSHTVCSVLAGFNTPCTTYRVTADPAASRADGGGGSLARTGVYSALFVVVALTLLVAGRGLLDASRRRRRQAERAGRQGAAHLARSTNPVAK